ncbi:MAG: GNAT family N-acetyltransferase [Rhodopirellula sp.]|nr:GNAT family N-acetyltransferase [Rhodopirellula sp.]
MKLITNLRHKFAKANGIRQQFGLTAMLQHGINTVGGRLLGFEALTLVWLPVDEMKIALDLPDDTEMRFLTAAEVESFAQDPANDFVESHVEKAHAGTDLCFAAIIDGRLASYGWYTLGRAFSIGDHDLLMRGPSNAAYMHSGFTHPDFRGRRLHGIGMGRALHALSDRGVDALLSDVNWANHASLKSCARLGYQMLGNLYSCGRGRCRCVSTPKAARRLGITFERVSDSETAITEPARQAA